MVPIFQLFFNESYALDTSNDNIEDCASLGPRDPAQSANEFFLWEFLYKKLGPAGAISN
jgi:hypothetical protein